MVTGSEECDQDYIECLSTFLTLTPRFSVPPEVQGSSCDIEKHQEFKTWLKNRKSSATYLHGQRGVGKGVFSTILLRTLRKQYPEGVPVIYYSFTDQDEKRTSSTGLISSLILQILSQDPQRFGQVRDLYLAIKGRSTWDLEALWTCLQALLDARESELILCIFNKIHNCDSSQTRLLTRLLDCQQGKNLSAPLKMILIGELRQDIQDSLVSCPYIPFEDVASLQRPMQAEADRFIAELMEEKPFLLEFESDLKEKLYKCEDFLQLSVTFNVLTERKHTHFSTQQAVRSELQALPYEIPDWVTVKIQTLPEWANKALGWTLNAQRPLKINELAAALALVEDEKSIKLDEAKLLLDLSANIKQIFQFLVKVESNEVRWSHEQVKDYFGHVVTRGHRQNTDRTQSERSARDETQCLDHWSVTRILLKYLSSEDFIGPVKQALRQDKWEKPRGPMFDMMAYAVSFWPAHYRKAKEQGSYAEAVFEYLKNSDLILVLWQLYSRLGCINLPPGLCAMDPLSLAAYLGLADVVDVCLKMEMPKGVAVAARGTAIALASWVGHLDIVTKLFDDAFDKETSKDVQYLTQALVNALERKHEDIVKFLTDHIPKPTGSFLWDPVLLCRAAEVGYETLVRTFITVGAGVEVTHEGTTPLQFAAKHGRESIVKLLLSFGADVNSDAAEDSFKPIMYAAKKGYTPVVQLLIQHEVGIHRSNGDGLTALHLAAQHGHQEITSLLLKRAPDLAARDRKGRTALHLASLNGHVGVVKILVQIAPTSVIDTLDNDGDSPLRLASKKGHLSVVEALLERGARVDVTGTDHHTALYSAVTNGHEAAAETILQRMIAIKTQYVDIVDVIQKAAESGFLRICKLCLQILDDEIVDSVKRRQWKALHQAAQNGHDEMVGLLLDNDYDIESKNEKDMTPLAVATLAGKWKVVQVLLDRKANKLMRNWERQTLVSQLAALPQEHSLDGHVDTIRALLNADILIDDVDRLGRSALHHAVSMGNLVITQELLRSGANPRLRDSMCRTPLHYAAQVDKKISNLLLERKADPQVCQYGGWTPFHIAAQSGNVDVMEVLWKAAPAVIKQSINNGRTPLHFADNQIGAKTWLLAHNIEVDTKDDSGDTALMTAARSGCISTVDLLLSYKADPQLRDNSMKTALHHAAAEGSVSVAQRLLERDISIINYSDYEQQSALHVAIQRKQTEFARKLLTHQPYIDINLQDGDGNTALLLAVKRMDVITAQLLVESGADTEARNKVGQTALLIAVSNGEEKLWKMLLDRPNGSNINAGGGIYPTALHNASYQGELKTVEQLVNHGANVNARGGQYHTALQAAAASGFDDVVEYLLERGADASVIGGQFSNALNAAAYSGTFGVVPKLSDWGAAINAKDDQGRTALHLAAWRGSRDVIDWLVERDSDLSVKDHQGRTILHHAAIGGNADIVEWLLSNEERRHLNVQDIDGWTPLHWACRSEANKEVVRLLMYRTDSGQRTLDGWTPENICAFHDAQELLLTMNPRISSDSDTSNNPDLRGTSYWKTRSTHWGLCCDGCEETMSKTLSYCSIHARRPFLIRKLKPIYGLRWHCIDCSEFNYCFKWFWTQETTHPGHVFEKCGEGPERSLENRTVND